MQRKEPTSSQLQRQMHIRPCLVIKIQNVLNPDMDKKDNKLSTTTKKRQSLL